MKYWDIVLTDVDGTSAIVQNNGTSDNRGVYKITAASAGTYYYYIDWSGLESFKFEKFSIQKKTGGGYLWCAVQWKVDGTWIDGGLSESYSTDQNLKFDATQALAWNTIDIEQVCYGVPIRVKCVVENAGIILAQALRS